ncbi:hypothetical protein GCM10027176_37680 [Actinoallomurus bryophytorum]|uniref:Uncharacterized protein n=1 Tax=Actinoallomurus bryophytorum TaxID=1490222 RepID=A0A543CJ18_9ACTN|nr:hypothetical protein FB559_2663 [Actinoallomurus bryophytorum]
MTPVLTQRLLQSDTAVGFWTLDPARTTVRITHKTFWGMGTVKAAFADVQGGGEIRSDHSVTDVIPWVRHRSTPGTGNATHICAVAGSWTSRSIPASS